MAGQVPSIDPVSANEIRSTGLQNYQMQAQKAAAADNFLTDFLKTAAVRRSEEIGAIEARATDRVMSGG